MLAGWLAGFLVFKAHEAFLWTVCLKRNPMLTFQIVKSEIWVCYDETTLAVALTLT